MTSTVHRSNEDESNSSQETLDKKRKESFYLPELDILRFFAFFIVFIHHAFPYEASWFEEKLKVSPQLADWIHSAVSGGGFGVDLFFALSSYLITELLIREYERNGKINAFAFYMRRGLRIYPLYYTFIFLTLFVFPYFFQDSLPFPHNISFLIFTANWTCAIYNYPPSVANPLWSVSIEEQFYFLCPLLISFFGVKNLKSLAVALILIAIFTRFLLVFFNAPDYSVWFVTFSRLDPIAAGILLAVFFRKGVIRPFKQLKIRILVGIGCLVLSLLAIKLIGSEGYNVLYTYLIIAFSSFWLIVSFIHPEKIKEKRYEILIYLGRISYGLYVFHLLGIIIAEKIAVHLAATGLNYVLIRVGGGLLVTIILSAISYKFLEKPFLNLKRKFTYIKSR